MTLADDSGLGAGRLPRSEKTLTRPAAQLERLTPVLGHSGFSWAVTLITLSGFTRLI